MKYISSLIITLAVAVAALAAPPKLVVPDQAEVGDVISAKLDGPSLATDWKVTDPASGKPVNVIVLPDGSLVFGSGAKARKITVRAAVAYQEGTTTKAALLEGTIQVGEPQPEPQPGPQPQPQPDLPDGTYGLAKFTKANTAGDVKGLGVLAASFRSMKTQVAAGRFVKLEDALTATAAANRDALSKAGIAAAQYEPLFAKLQDK